MQILNKEQILNVAGGVACECGCNNGPRFTALNDKACHDICCSNPKITQYRTIDFDSHIQIMGLDFDEFNAVCKPCTKYGVLTRNQKNMLCAQLASNR